MKKLLVSLAVLAGLLLPAQALATNPTPYLTNYEPLISTNRTDATFTWDVSGSPTGFKCKIDTGANNPCTSPFTKTGLSSSSGSGTLHTLDLSALWATGGTTHLYYSWNVSTDSNMPHKSCNIQANLLQPFWAPGYYVQQAAGTEGGQCDMITAAGGFTGDMYNIRYIYEQTKLWERNPSDGSWTELTKSEDACGIPPATQTTPRSALLPNCAFYTNGPLYPHGWTFYPIPDPAKAANVSSTGEAYRVTVTETEVWWDGTTYTDSGTGPEADYFACVLYC